MTVEALAKIIILQGLSEEPERKISAVPVKRRHARATTKKASPLGKKLRRRRT